MIVLVSDNGASGEGGPNGSVNENKFFNGIPTTSRRTSQMIDELGSPKTYNHYPNGWAMAFNTPFKMWKRYEFNGGTRDPCIISWPKGIKAKGEIRHQYHHAIDIVPTILDCLGVEPPETIKGHVQSSFDGISMRYSFDEGSIPTARATQFYSMLGSRAIWHDGWKAISTHPDNRRLEPLQRRYVGALQRRRDRAELHDLADEHPEKLRELINLWFSEAGANGAFPLDDRSRGRDHQHPASPGHAARATATATSPASRRFPRHRRSTSATATTSSACWVDIPAAGRERGAVRARLALRRPHAVRQGQPAALRLQLRRHARAEDRRDRGLRQSART